MKSRRGFTLIEVIVAMAVLGIACSALFGLLSSSLFNLRKLEDVHRYQLAALDVMRRIQVLTVLPPEGNAAGKVADLDADWKVSVRPWVPATLAEKPAEAIMKIDVDIVWAGRAGQRSFRLETVKPASISYDTYSLNEAISKAFPR